MILSNDTDKALKRIREYDPTYPDPRKATPSKEARDAAREICNELNGSYPASKIATLIDTAFAPKWEQVRRLVEVVVAFRDACRTGSPMTMMQRIAEANAMLDDPALAPFLEQETKAK